MKEQSEDFPVNTANGHSFPDAFLDSKELQVLERIAGMMRYWPDDELYPALLLSLLKCSREFKRIRSVPHLSRLICADYFLKKKVITHVNQSPHKRHLFVKLLRTRLEFPFGCKSVLGVTIAFNLLKQREVFEEQHVLDAVRRIVPRTKVVKGSFFDGQDNYNQIDTVYLEMECEEEREFSKEEIAKLEKELPRELKGCIEQLVPMTFMRRNEEEVYRNILTLRDQLKSVKDIPQATISFEEQTQLDLFFTVVLLRVVRGEDPSVKDLFEKANPGVTFILDRIDIVGQLRKSACKEASVFRIQLSKTQFFRKDRSVNLYKARRSVVGMLINALGQVRDYNGGLILKQNERLEDFLSLMPKFYDEFLLENFFYSITPIAMQSVLPASLVKAWFMLFSELMEEQFKETASYLLRTGKYEEGLLAIVRAEDSSFKEVLMEVVKELEIPSLELAFTEINAHGIYCFGFLFRPSQYGKEEEFLTAVQEAMDQWAKKCDEGQVLRICLRGNEPSLDPRITKGDQSYIIIKMLYEGLTRIGHDGKPYLAIAKSFEATPDFKKYTFYLRETKWSNGAPITAYDFEYSWKKALHPSAHSIFANTLFIIKNAKKANQNLLSLDEVGIQAIDDKTLVVELEYPAPYFLELTAHWSYSLINSHIDRKFPGWAYQAGENYVCNGPFKLVEWKHNRMITVEKNPHYWDAKAVKLSKIHISMIEGFQNEWWMFENGEMDIVGRPMTSPPLTTYQELPDDVERVTYSLLGSFSLWFNIDQFPFNHKKLRQAFAYVIDRKMLAEAVNQEFGCSATSLLPKELTLHADPLFPDKDIERGRRLFKEGLGEIGMVKSDLSRFTLSYAGGMNRGNLFKMLQQQWKEAFDIDVFVESYDWDTLFDRVLEGDFQIAALELRAWWRSPIHILECFEKKSDRLNFSRWEHEKYSQLLERASKSSEVTERSAYFKECEAILAEEVPAVPLYQLSGSYLKKKNLKGENASPFFEIDFKYATFEGQE